MLSSIDLVSSLMGALLSSRSLLVSLYHVLVRAVKANAFCARSSGGIMRFAAGQLWRLSDKQVIFRV